MILHCYKKLATIHCMKIRKEDTHKKLKNCFKLATTINYTRGFHCFMPCCQFRFSIKQITNNVNFLYTSSFHPLALDIRAASALAVKQSNFVIAIYNQKWYINKILGKDESNCDTLGNFMQPND